MNSSSRERLSLSAISGSVKDTRQGRDRGEGRRLTGVREAASYPLFFRDDILRLVLCDLDEVERRSRLGVRHLEAARDGEEP